MRILLAVALFLSSLTNAEVVRLVKAGLSAETVEAKIAASETSFDTSTDALVALAGEGVPDRVIRAMIARTTPEGPAPRLAPVPPAPPAAPASPAPRAVTRRYDVAILTADGVRCEGAELRLDARNVAATRCRKLDFKIALASLERVCYEYGFRGTITFRTAAGERRISTVTPAEAKRIVDHLRANAPFVPVGECRR